MSFLYGVIKTTYYIYRLGKQNGKTNIYKNNFRNVEDRCQIFLWSSSKMEIFSIKIAIREGIKRATIPKHKFSMRLNCLDNFRSVWGNYNTFIDFPVLLYCLKNFFFSLSLFLRSAWHSFSLRRYIMLKFSVWVCVD